MKGLIWLILFTISATVSAQNGPLVNKTLFSEEALNQSIIDFNNNEIRIRDILKKHEGKVFLIDLWASWCGDCIKNFALLKEFKSKNKDVGFVYISLDRDKDLWHSAVKKYDLQGDHYWFNSGWKNKFNQNIDLNWIPRFLLIDKSGNIIYYYSVSLDDLKLQKAIEKTKI